MTQLEKKVFTNLYWNTIKQDLVVVGQYGTEQKGHDKVKDPEKEPQFIYQDTIAATLSFEYNKEIVKERKDVDKD